MATYHLNAKKTINIPPYIPIYIFGLEVLLSILSIVTSPPPFDNDLTFTSLGLLIFKQL